MKLASKNNRITSKEAKKKRMYQLRKCKQNTTNMTPLQAHFEIKPPTPLSNMITVPKNHRI